MRNSIVSRRLDIIKDYTGANGEKTITKENVDFEKRPWVEKKTGNWTRYETQDENLLLWRDNSKRKDLRELKLCIVAVVGFPDIRNEKISINRICCEYVVWDRLGED